MPQTRVTGSGKGFSKDASGRRRGHPIQCKFRIGGRSAGVSGHTMSTEDLIAVVGRGGKNVQNARQVLHARGVEA